MRGFKKQKSVCEFVPLYRAHANLTKKDFSEQDVGQYLLTEVLKNARVEEKTHKNKPDLFWGKERNHLEYTFSSGYSEKGSVVRIDDVFNGSTWKRVRKVQSFADAAAYLYLDRQQYVTQLVEAFGHPEVLRAFDYDIKTGEKIEDMVLSDIDKTKLSYFSALRKLGTNIQEEWGVMVLPYDFGKK